MVKRLELTPAARPELQPDESFVFVQDVVGLYSGKSKIPNYQNGCAYLTTHRLCYVDNAEPRKYSIAVDLKDVKHYEIYSGFLRSSPKITLIFQPHNTASTPKSPASRSGGPSPRNLTPKAASPAIWPANTTWICPICSFPNPIPSNYAPYITPVSSIPPCLACGIKPQPSVLDNVVLSQTPVPTIPPLSSASPNKLPLPSTPTPPPRQSSSSGGKGFACPRCTFENHPSLSTCEMCGERLVSADILERGLLDEIGRTESPGPFLIEGLNLGDGGTTDTIKFSFRAGGAQAFFEKLKNVMVQSKWLLQNAPPVPKPNRGNDNEISSNNNNQSSGERPKIVGIAGLERHTGSIRKNNDMVMRAALDDLDSLMSRAKEMVSLAESFATRLASQQSPSSSEASRALQYSTTALGLSTVRKDQVSADLYLADLARQIAEFLSDDRKAILKREGGVITLVDLWAIYNRAREIDLISPSDLEKAAGMFEKLKLPVKLKRFKSGLLVVQEAGRTDEVTMKKIMGWIESLSGYTRAELGKDGNWGRGITPLEAAERFGWSVGVATEELEMAEEKGWLCREVGVEGVRFWINFLVPDTSP